MFCGVWLHKFPSGLRIFLRSLFMHASNKHSPVVINLLRTEFCIGNIKIYIIYQGWGQFNSGIGIAVQFQFQFRNWNWNWNWNWWNWKWNWNWKPWNWNWKPELNFLQLLPKQFLVNQPFPNLSFNRGGHNLSCHWLIMQQVFLGHCPPVVWSQKTHG